MRPLRRSPLYDRLQRKGAVFGTKLNWERANYFRAAAARAAAAAHARHARLAAVGARRAARMPRGRRRLRPDVVRARFVLQGPRRARACCSACARTRSTSTLGRIVYTAMLNARGGFESDVTDHAPRAPTRFFILTGSAQTHARPRLDRAPRRATTSTRALVDVTSAYSRAVGDGAERAEALLGRVVARDDLSQAGRAPFATTREIDVGYARVRAARMSYVGGPGYELYVPTDQCATLYDALTARRRRPFGAARRRLLHARRAAHRGRPARLGRRAVARTRRRSRPASCSRCALDKRDDFIGKTRCCASARSACPHGS